MEVILLDDFADGGIIREKTFRAHIESYDWKKFANKKVLIKGCANTPIPTWAYMIVTAKLTGYTNKIYYGEKCSAYKIS
tara:strand:+ start:867 stop:1103 length:237 start_codon:yes stop_codon:yes gene_type:complete